MARVRHIISNDMINQINELPVTDKVKSELINLYKFDPDLVAKIELNIQRSVAINLNSTVTKINVISNGYKIELEYGG